MTTKQLNTAVALQSEIEKLKILKGHDFLLKLKNSACDVHLSFWCEDPDYLAIREILSARLTRLQAELAAL